MWISNFTCQFIRILRQIWKIDIRCLIYIIYSKWLTTQHNISNKEKIDRYLLIHCTYFHDGVFINYLRHTIKNEKFKILVKCHDISTCSMGLLTCLLADSLDACAWCTFQNKHQTNSLYVSKMHILQERKSLFSYLTGVWIKRTSSSRRRVAAHFLVMQKWNEINCK